MSGGRVLFIASSVILSIQLLAAPAIAQVRDYLAGRSDVNRPWLYYSGVNRETCVGNGPTVILKLAPTKGVVTISEELVDLDPSKFPNCVGKKVKATVVRYTPKAGTSGLDRYWIFVSGTSPSDRGQVHDVAIWMVPAGQTSTLPPQRADIDRMLGPATEGPTVATQPAPGSTTVETSAGIVSTHVRRREIIVRDTQVDTTAGVVRRRVTVPRAPVAEPQ